MLTHDSSTYCALPFEEARAFVHALKLGSQKEWQEYSKSGKRPPNIPSSPWKTYVRRAILVCNPSYYTPLYTFITTYTPMYTHYTCIYTIYTSYIHLTHL